MLSIARMRSLTLGLAFVVMAGACARREPASSPSTTAAGCPCGMHGGGMARMGGMGGQGMSMEGARPDAGTAAPLSPEARAALLRAIDEEYRAEALYQHILGQIGQTRPMSMIARSERHHAWILESLAIAHGVEIPPNAWAGKRMPDVGDAREGCRAGVESEKKTIALYDELLKVELPDDLKRAFTHLRAVSADHHLRAFEACS